MMNDVSTRAYTLSGLLLSFAACGGTLPFPGLTAEEVFALGLQAREQENWGDAAEAFEYVLFSPGFNRAAEARLLLAEVHYSNRRYVESRSEYQRVIDRWRPTPWRFERRSGFAAHSRTCHPLRRGTKLSPDRAGSRAGRWRGDFAGTVMGLEAGRLADEMTLKLAERDYDTGRHYLRRGLLDSALLYFEEVASEYPETEWAPWALYRMIDAFGRIRYQRDVEATRDLLLDAYPDSEPAQLLLEDGGA